MDSFLQPQLLLLSGSYLPPGLLNPLQDTGRNGLGRDVYKRQLSQWKITTSMAAWAAQSARSAPVSYTHLDVYKRQLYDEYLAADINLLRV